MIPTQNHILDAWQHKKNTKGRHPRCRQDASEQYASLIKKETGATKVQQGTLRI